MSGWHAKDTLLGIELDFVMLQVGESFAQIIEECRLLFCFDDDVIDVDLDVASDLLFDSIFHHTLVRSTHVLEPEGHSCVAVDPDWGYERRFFFVFLLHPYLVIA